MVACDNCPAVSYAAGISRRITMKKGLCISLILAVTLLFPAFTGAAVPVRVLHETPQSITMAVEVPEPYFAHGVDPVRACAIEGFVPGNNSAIPGLPEYGFLVAIPRGATAKISTEVLSVQELNTVHTGAFTFGDQFTDDVLPAQPARLDSLGVLRGTPVAHIVITPLQYNNALACFRVVRNMIITLHIGAAADGVSPRYTAQTVPSSRTGDVFNGIKKAAIINTASTSIAMPRIHDVSATPAAAPAAFEGSPFAIKIVTSAAGMYRVNYADISGLGADLSGLTVSNLKIQNQGSEIAVYRSGTGLFDGGDYIVFYAEEFTSDYSSTNVYWLYQGAGNGLTMQSAGSAPVSSYPQPDFFTTVLRLEQDTTWRRNLPQYVSGEDEWFWKRLAPSLSLTINFSLENFSTTAGDFNIELYLRALTEFAHLAEVDLNGTLLGGQEWVGAVSDRRTFAGIPPNEFNDGANTLTVEALLAPGNEITTPDQYYVNWAELTYSRLYAAENDRLAFGSDTSGGTTFEITGFTDAAILVFDVSQPLAPVLLTGTDITNSGAWQVRFERSIDASSQFCATTLNGTLTPDTFVLDEPSSLAEPRSNVDYIIITHAQFAAQIEQLQTLRELGGLGVEIVDVQDIYDEFSYGIKDATAIKEFLRYAYTDWHATDHPTYVVLVGDATYDYRDRLGQAASGKADLVPTYLGYRGSLGTSIGAVASDNWFVSVDGDDPLPDMVIGRLCVKNSTDLQNILDKIDTYESVSSGEWRSRLLFAADSDEFNQFENLTESILENIPGSYTKLRLNLREYDSDISTATDDLVAAISNGVLLTSYIGHGATDTWSKSFWLRTPNQNTGVTRDDVARLSNADMYTFLVVLNCLSGTFSEVTDDYSTAEEFLRQPERGAIACVAPSASAAPEDHEVFGSALYENLFQNTIATAGTLATVSKIDGYRLTASRDILETFIFFGDPALELKVPATVEPPDDLQPAAPLDGSWIPLEPFSQFSWEPAAYTLFKIEFSQSGLFDDKKEYFAAPRRRRQFIEQDSYVPDKSEWRKLLKLYRTTGVIYWRVVAYDPASLEPLQYSDSNTFLFTPQPPEGIASMPTGDISTSAPLDSAQLPVEPIAQFSWDPGSYTVFKVQFSRSGLFDRNNDYFDAPRKKDEFITQDSYVPESREWRKIQKFFQKRGSVFWRVVACDPLTHEPLDYSEVSSFGF